MIRILIILLLLSGCAAIKAPADFVYEEIPTKDFTLASWQKITVPFGTYKIYIEGDGYAFNAHGRAAQDPTPRGTLVRKLAFGDDSPNVVYLARPCQYVTSSICSKRHWTTARFAHEIINAEYEAIKQHNLPPLNESMNLESYRKQFAKIPQIHYVGSDDEIMPPALVREFVGKSGNIIEVRGATHNSGWEEIYPEIRNEK